MAEIAVGAGRVLGGLLLGAATLTVLHMEGSDPTRGSLLQLALRTSAGRAQVCRTLSEDELAGLPQHMRRPTACEMTPVAYRLQVKIDEVEVADERCRPAGIHGDRPITHSSTIAVTPGDHDVAVRFAPETSVAASDKPLPTYAFDGRIAFDEGRIRIVSLEGDDTDFVVK
ncbi:MAG: hypothetical protein HY899_11550 [Deltaproteobacteria bacterium]|nr:hypothetical protein [Deltaproteobacteria bacterium]